MLSKCIKIYITDFGFPVWDNIDFPNKSTELPFS